jgi:transaldolase
MAMNPLQQLGALGQSVWCDFIERRMLGDGEFAQLIERDGVSGVTTNPTIFEKALAAGDAYAADIAALARGAASAEQMADALMRDDVRRAADMLRPVYEHTAGADGYVSLEVSPHLAHDAPATIAAAQAAWDALARPNVMIKIPATPEGIEAIRSLIAAGVNVNATLLFSVARYLDVAHAYAQGLEARAAANLPLERIASVASFFVSRIDTLIDSRIDSLIDSFPTPQRRAHALALRGQAAIACARLAYLEFERMQCETAWLRLAARGAQPQRLLWASSSTKNPRYRDTVYVDALIGPRTVATLTRETLAAYRQHGEPALRLGLDLAHAEPLGAELAHLGIDLEQVAAELEADGLHRFAASEDALHARIAKAAAGAR